MARIRRYSAVLLIAVFALAARPHAQNTAAPAQNGQPQTQTPANGQATDQPPPAPGQPPIFRAGINFVRVDVIVTDKNGNPVDNLKPEDFEVSEQGTAQKIETFKLISLDGG